jgi:hypothetical protein
MSAELTQPAQDPIKFFNFCERQIYFFLCWDHNLNSSVVDTVLQNDSKKGTSSIHHQHDETLHTKTVVMVLGSNSWYGHDRIGPCTEL